MVNGVGFQPSPYKCKKDLFSCYISAKALHIELRADPYLFGTSAVLLKGPTYLWGGKGISPLQGSVVFFVFLRRKGEGKGGGYLKRRKRREGEGEGEGRN